LVRFRAFKAVIRAESAAADLDSGLDAVVAPLSFSWGSLPSVNDLPFPSGMFIAPSHSPPPTSSSQVSMLILGTKYWYQSPLVSMIFSGVCRLHGCENSRSGEGLEEGDVNSPGVLSDTGGGSKHRDLT